MCMHPAVPSPPLTRNAAQDEPPCCAFGPGCRLRQYDALVYLGLLRWHGELDLEIPELEERSATIGVYALPPVLQLGFSALDLSDFVLDIILAVRVYRGGKYGYATLLLVGNLMSQALYLVNQRFINFQGQPQETIKYTSMITELLIFLLEDATAVFIFVTAPELFEDPTTADVANLCATFASALFIVVRMFKMLVDQANMFGWGWGFGRQIVLWIATRIGPIAWSAYTGTSTALRQMSSNSSAALRQEPTEAMEWAIVVVYICVTLAASVVACLHVKECLSTSSDVEGVDPDDADVGVHENPLFFTATASSAGDGAQA